jgi:tRNA A37 threonylcarbamoyladenosine synthetase subunit TsaC/SUA5/YrdC
MYTPENVEKIFTIKQRDTKKTFSIIAPNFERIKENYQVTNPSQLPELLDKYHGITYIFDYNRPGVRIIKHSFQQFVENLGQPFITTSCNIA